jgi:hypothetical protein
MKNTPQAWERLTATARSAPDERDVLAPFGFATRVAALAMAERPTGSLIERFALRAMIMACGLAIVAVAVNYSSVRGLFAQEQTPAPDDPVAEMADLAS